MEMKFVIILLLAVSLAIFGCAKKGQTGNVTGNLSAAPGGEPPAENSTGAAGNASSGPRGGSGGTGDKNGNLSGLFNIDTEKPVGGEGLDTGMPGADK